MDGPRLQADALGDKVVLKVGAVHPAACKRHVFDDGEFVKIDLPGSGGYGDLVRVLREERDGGT